MSYGTDLPVQAPVKYELVINLKTPTELSTQAVVSKPPVGFFTRRHELFLTRPFCVRVGGGGPYQWQWRWILGCSSVFASY